ncbi:helix-turn-helix domain-containing protein [Nocardia vinacea]|uniref:helix-turn-helix domain-containing protein n=1 Tax=Nocardia vinacea TaxID=96468 RepID=UPI0033CD08C8
MDDVELVEQVRRRWEQGVPPKAIARALGVRPSVVAPLVRRIAAEAEASRGLGRVLGCWVNCGWSVGLGLEGHAEWAELDVPAGEAEGFAQVFVAREGRRGRATLRGYLADLHCLGVKNATDPETMDAGRIPSAIRVYYASFDCPALEIPIELGRQLILGAVQYARGLGFEPADAFDGDAAAFLGEWDGPGRIEFGRDGQPFYLNGPYDDPAAVIRTLEQSVGAGNFHFSVATGPM